MANTLYFSANGDATTKVVQFYNPVLQTWVDGTLVDSVTKKYTATMAGIPAGTYTGLKSRLKGSSPEIISIYSDGVIVRDGNTTTPPVGTKATMPTFGTLDDINNIVGLTSDYPYTEVMWGVENGPAQQLGSNSICSPGNIAGRLYAYVVANTAAGRLQSDTRFSGVFTIAAAVNNEPTVTLASPQAGQALNVGDMVVLNASPLDADGANDIKRVVFLDNGVPFAETTGAPHTVQRSLTTGSHSFTARVYDLAGASGLSNAVAISAAVSTLPDLALFFGDSLTYGNDDPSNSYPEKIKAILGPNVEVRNFGVNGQPISRALAGTSVLGSINGQIAAIDRSKYRRIVGVVDGGVNDARLLAANYPGQDAVALTFAARKATHQALVAAGIPTIALSHTNYDYPASGGQISPAINTAIRTTAQEEDKYIRAYWRSELLAQGFVDFAGTKLSWETPDPTYYTSDGVHYAPIGSLEKANKVALAVLAVLAGNTYGVVTPLATTNTVVLQDTSSAITYSPDWFFADASGGTPDAFVYSGGTAHVAQNAGTPLYADVVIPIACAELEYWLIDFIHPISVDLSVGGGAVTTIRVAAVPANTNSVNKRTISGPFVAGQVLHVASTPGASDAHVVLDKIAFNRQAVQPPTAPGHTYATAGNVEESSVSCEYEGTSWRPASGFPSEYGTDGSGKNNTSGTDPMAFYFDGTKAEYWSFSHPGSSDFFVSIDGGAAIAITGVATQETSASKVLYTTPTLAAGKHSLRIIPKGSGMLTVARFVVY